MKEEGTQIPNFTEEEVQEAAKNLKGKRAPGPDGIPPEAVKMLAKFIPGEVVAKIMSDLLKKRTFPSRWKSGKLELLKKPGTEAGSEKTCIPICLLNALGKLYEQLQKTA